MFWNIFKCRRIGWVLQNEWFAAAAPRQSGPKTCHEGNAPMAHVLTFRVYEAFSYGPHWRKRSQSWEFPAARCAWLVQLFAWRLCFLKPAAFWGKRRGGYHGIIQVCCSILEHDTPITVYCFMLSRKCKMNAVAMIRDRINKRPNSRMCVYRS